MPLLADPVVAAKLQEFRMTVAALIEAEFMTDGDRIEVIKELCELSRSAKFDLGPSRFADATQVEEVACCFEEAVASIRGIWGERPVPADAEKFCGNILRRSRRCRGAE